MEAQSDSFSSVEKRWPNWREKINLIVQLSLAKHPNLPDVPLIFDYIRPEFVDPQPAVPRDRNRLADHAGSKGNGASVCARAASSARPRSRRYATHSGPWCKIRSLGRTLKEAETTLFRLGARRYKASLRRWAAHLNPSSTCSRLRSRTEWTKQDQARDRHGHEVPRRTVIPDSCRGGRTGEKR